MLVTKNMNIAIVGSSGYIAKHIINAFECSNMHGNIIKIDQTDNSDLMLQLNHPEQFDYEKLKSIDYIIYTAAISSPDKCANEYDACWEINVNGTKYFIQKALEMKINVLFFSSDAVFGDILGYIYNENSETKAFTAYGKMKKAIEDEFKNNQNFKCIRLSYVVSENDKFISYCIECIKNNETADIFHPFYRNCVTVSDVIKAILWLIQNWDDFNSFVLNIAGKELVSRIRMADEINRYLGNKLKYKISQPENNFYKNRPRITQMQSLYLYKLKILEDTTFSEKISNELKNIKL